MFRKKRKNQNKGDHPYFSIQSYPVSETDSNMRFLFTRLQKALFYLISGYTAHVADGEQFGDVKAPFCRDLLLGLNRVVLETKGIQPPHGYSVAARGGRVP